MWCGFCDVSGLGKWVGRENSETVVVYCRSQKGVRDEERHVVGRRLPRRVLVTRDESREATRSGSGDVEREETGRRGAWGGGEGDHEDVFRVYGPDDDPRGEHIREEKRSLEAMELRRAVLRRVLGRLDQGGLALAEDSGSVKKEVLLFCLTCIASDESQWNARVSLGSSSTKGTPGLLELCIQLMEQVPAIDPTESKSNRRELNYEVTDGLVIDEGTSSEFPEDNGDVLSLEDALAAKLLAAGIELACESFTGKDVDELQLLKLRSPHLWYQKVQEQGPRKVVLHIGPTNSGKTFNCVEKLAGSSSGIFLAPSRLLAWEVRNRLETDFAKPCSVFAGSDVHRAPGARHVSVTPQAFGNPQPVALAVVDEAHHIADPIHGWKISRSILGLPCQELHICTDPVAHLVIEKMLSFTSDQVDEVRYRRMAPLQLPETPLKGKVESLQRGDCVLVKSEDAVYRLRGRISRHTNLKCSVLHARMSARTVHKEIEAFNTGLSDVLVTTDVVGDGLNLNVDRVIFWDVDKLDGNVRRPLSHLVLRQIGGRAGRYTSEFSQGEVCVQDLRYLRAVRNALSSAPPIVESVPIFPDIDILVKLSEVLASTRPNSSGDFEIHRLVDQLALLVEVDFADVFTLHDLISVRRRSRLLSELALDFEDKYFLSLAPFNVTDPIVCDAALRFAKGLVDSEAIDVGLDERVLLQPQSLREVEKIRSYISVVDLYLWLGLVYPDQFCDVPYAQELRQDLGRLVLDST